MMKVAICFLLAIAAVFAQSCDTDVLTDCSDTYSSCVTDATTADEICECYIAFGACASCAGDCYTEEQVTALEDACDQAGCDGCDGFWSCEDGGDGDGVAAVVASAAVVAGALAF